VISHARILHLVDRRLDNMSRRPRMWAGTQESFILQLALLIEFSYLGKRRHDPHAVMMALCGSETGNCVPSGPITPVWAHRTAWIARTCVWRGAQEAEDQHKKAEVLPCAGR